MMRVKGRLRRISQTTQLWGWVNFDHIEVGKWCLSNLTARVSIANKIRLSEDAELLIKPCWQVGFLLGVRLENNTHTVNSAPFFYAGVISALLMCGMIGMGVFSLWFLLAVLPLGWLSCVLLDTWILICDFMDREEG